MENITDIIDKKFGKLTVKRISTVFPKLKWICLCDCGSEIDVLESSLKSENTKSCGCSRGGVVTNYEYHEKLTQVILKRFLCYEPETGIFTWLKKPANNINIGDIAGAKERGTDKNYIAIRIFKKIYYAHRLAIFYMTGEWPDEDKCVDHINRNGDDNRWINIHVVEHSENTHNSKTQSNNISGFKGVNFCKRSEKWYASININYKHINLGRFDTFDEAVKSRQKANIKYNVYDG